MSVIVGRALPDVRDGLKPVHRRVLFSMNENGLAPNRALPQVRERRRRRDGSLPPARRPVDLRHARPPGAAVRDARAARRRPGQLRLDRRRSRRRHAVHRGAPRAPRDRDAARHRLGHGRLRARTTTTRARSRSCSRRATRTCWSTARRASRSAWRRTSRRTTCASRSTRSSPTSTTRRSRLADLMKHIKGPDFPTGGIIVGRSGDQGRLRDRPRPDRRPRAARTSSRCARARRRSSSPRCPTRSRRVTGAATAAV